MGCTRRGPSCTYQSPSFPYHSIGIIEEEDDIYVVEETFRQAYRNSQADTICVPGLQEFAGSVSKCRLVLGTILCSPLHMLVSLALACGHKLWLSTAGLGTTEEQQFRPGPA